MKEKLKDLKSQLHTLCDLFYEDTGWLPQVDVETKEVEVRDKEIIMASNVQVLLK